MEATWPICPCRLPASSAPSCGNITPLGFIAAYFWSAAKVDSSSCLSLLPFGLYRHVELKAFTVRLASVKPASWLPPALIHP